MSIPNKGLVLVDLWAPWCGPCRVMTPIVESLEREMNFTLVKANVDEMDSDPFVRGLVEKYNINAVPTFLIFKDGVCVQQFSGTRTKNNLKMLMEQVI